MKYYDLHDTYKDLYFHELDVREKLVNRIQLTFAFHVTIVTVIAYMLRTVDFNSQFELLLYFYLSISVAFLLLTRSFYEAVRSFWGNEYKALPTANEIESYRISILKHEEEVAEYRKEYPDSDEIDEFSGEEKLNDYLYNIYADCASHNTKTNDNRSKRIHTAIKYILLVSAPLLISISCFILGDMDASSPRKKTQAEVLRLESKIDDLTNALLLHVNSENPNESTTKNTTATK